MRRVIFAFFKTKLMIVLGAKVGCESCVRKLCAEVCAKKKSPYVVTKKQCDIWLMNSNFPIKLCVNGVMGALNKNNK